MIAALDPTIPVIVGAILGPLVAYLLAARRFSGKIATSDASDLWKESRSIREWSSARISILDTELALLRTRIGLVENQNAVLVHENNQLMTQVRELNAEIVGLRAEITALTGELRSSRERVHELEERVDGD